MIAWVVGVPVFLMVMVMGLERLEAYVVAPSERTDRIRKLVAVAPPEVIERQVATILAPAVQSRAALREIL